MANKSEIILLFRERLQVAYNFKVYSPAGSVLKSTRESNASDAVIDVGFVLP